MYENEQQKRLIFGGGAALIGLVCLIAVCGGGGLFGGSDPSGHVRDTYQRTASLDRADGGTAYTADSSPRFVVSDLRDNTDERDHRSTFGVEFLQYDRHIIAVEEHDNGSAIYLDDYRDGYRHYSSAYPAFAAFGWSSSPPRSGFLGGGSGFGK